MDYAEAACARRARTGGLCVKTKFLRNIPNVLSCIRLVLVPVFVGLFFSGLPAWCGVSVYLLAGLTDILDGRLARRNGWTSALGKVLDPLADKLLQTAGAVCLLVSGLLPLWMVLVPAAKEAVLLAGGTVLLKKRGMVLSSNILGKTASAVFYSVIPIIMLLRPSEAVRKTLFFAATLLSLCALTGYTLQALGVHAPERAACGKRVGASRKP